MAERRRASRESLGATLSKPMVLVRSLIPEQVLVLLEAFWALPLVLTLIGVSAAVTVSVVAEPQLGKIFGDDGTPLDIEGARMALTVVAGGVITVTSLVFSLTFVALSITAQQLSPRILDYVVRDRTTQILVGLSLSTFLFSAIALAIGTSDGTMRLALSAIMALVLAALTLVMVVLFSHNLTRVMRAEDMVARLGAQFVKAIEDGPQSISDDMMVEDPDAQSSLEASLADGTTIRATRTGYLGAVDYRGLLAWLAGHGLLLEILERENAFVLEGQPVARVAGAHGAPDGIARHVTRFLNLTDRRVIGETAEYEGSSLSEAALRALSPGINDPATARSCANRLFQGLVMLAALPERPRVLAAEDGVPRLLRARHGIPELLENDVAPIVEATRDRTTMRDLADLADRLAEMANRPHELAAIEALRARIAAADPPPELHLRQGDRQEPAPSAPDGSVGDAAGEGAPAARRQTAGDASMG